MDRSPVRLRCFGDRFFPGCLRNRLHHRKGHGLADEVFLRRPLNILGRHGFYSRHVGIAEIGVAGGHPVRCQPRRLASDRLRPKNVIGDHLGLGPVQSRRVHPVVLDIRQLRQHAIQGRLQVVLGQAHGNQKLALHKGGRPARGVDGKHKRRFVFQPPVESGGPAVPHDHRQHVQGVKVGIGQADGPKTDQGLG